MNTTEHTTTGGKPLNKEQLADKLSITPRTVENWQRRGIIPHIKVGAAKQARVMYFWPDVEAALRRNCQVS